MNGGALASLGGIVSPSVRNATFSGNRADNGGAVYESLGATSAPSYANVTFANNTATSYGGAMYDYQASGVASLGMTNVTFNGNTAPAGNGGAMTHYNCGGATLTSTFTNLIVWGDGTGEVYFVCDAPTFKNSIVQGSGGSGAWGTGFGTDGGGNLDAEPKLGVLQDNGSGMPTRMPGSGSPAIDAGLDDACTSAPVGGEDQRGIARPLGAHCDIGALEALRLNLTVSDGSAYGMYSKPLQYIVTLQNPSATDALTGVHVTGLGSAALDAASTLWFCTAGSCTTSQAQGPLSDVVDLPASGVLTWIVNVPVVGASTATSATMAIHATGASPVTDTDTLVIFRSTFEP